MRLAQKWVHSNLGWLWGMGIATAASAVSLLMATSHGPFDSLDTSKLDSVLSMLEAKLRTEPGVGIGPRAGVQYVKVDMLKGIIGHTDPDDPRLLLPRFLLRKDLFISSGGNAKLDKSNKAGLNYHTRGLSLAPAKLSGFNTCSLAGVCAGEVCLSATGRAAIGKNGEPLILNDKWKARISRTRMFFMKRDAFKYMLLREIKMHARRIINKGQIPVMRLNVYSDMPWERIYPEIFTYFDGKEGRPFVQFYDYTKLWHRIIDLEGRKNKNLPPNYHLTYSLSEQANSEKLARMILKAGGNVAAVFRYQNRIPRTYLGAPVVSGDITDLRFIDPPGTIAGLYAKGAGAHWSRSGFVKDVDHGPYIHGLPGNEFLIDTRQLSGYRTFDKPPKKPVGFDNYLRGVKATGDLIAEPAGNMGEDVVRFRSVGKNAMRHCPHRSTPINIWEMTLRES